MQNTYVSTKLSSKKVSKMLSKSKMSRIDAKSCMEVRVRGDIVLD